MDDQHNPPRVIPGVHCGHIRHKAMFILSVPNPRAKDFYDEYDTASYWCAETCSAFGPDGHPVRPDQCTHERGCCRH